eukprot:1755818-Amphidinium_carterae.1
MASRIKEAREGDWGRVHSVQSRAGFGQTPMRGQCMGPQPAPQCIRVIVDSDHAGEPLRRRSTTGAFVIGKAEWLCHQERASPARAFAQRAGLGKQKHAHTLGSVDARTSRARTKRDQSMRPSRLAAQDGKGKSEPMAASAARACNP